jgi:hypothetical protein
MSDDQVADQIAAASSSDAPKMPSPLEGSIPLLRGLHSAATDEWHDTAVVRELNGADEEALTQLAKKKDLGYTEYMTGILERAVVSIGSLPAKGVIDKLILPDRDVLFLAIVKATYGMEREVRARCPECKEPQSLVLELDEDFKVEGMGRDWRTPATVELSKGTVEFRYPNGEDTRYATGESADNVAHLNTLIIARCVISSATFEENVEWARDLSIPDRRKMDDAIMSSMEGVGPQLGEVDTRCSECKAPVSYTMDWVSLLLS